MPNLHQASSSTSFNHTLSSLLSTIQAQRIHATHAHTNPAGPPVKPLYNLPGRWSGRDRPMVSLALAMQRKAMLSPAGQPNSIPKYSRSAANTAASSANSCSCRSPCREIISRCPLSVIRPSGVIRVHTRRCVKWESGEVCW